MRHQCGTNTTNNHHTIHIIPQIRPTRALSFDEFAPKTGGIGPIGHTPQCSLPIGEVLTQSHLARGWWRLLMIFATALSSLWQNARPIDRPHGRQPRCVIPVT